MSLNVHNATHLYLSKLLEGEEPTFISDLSELVVALVEKNTTLHDIHVDMEPFLKENTTLFIQWFVISLAIIFEINFFQA